MTTAQSSPLNFKILPATEEDCAEIATVEVVSNHDASKTKPEKNAMRLIFPPPGDVSSRAKDLIDKCHNDKTMRMWKAVVNDENGQEKIVAFSIWHYHLEPKVVDDWKDIEWPTAPHPQGCNDFIRSMTDMRKKHMSGKVFGHLQVLATLREYRGHGIGSALIKLGLDEGMRQGLTEFWLEASADGHGLYEKFGFRDVETLWFDLTKYGGEGVERVRTMRKVPH